jgi:hypothetical protein
MGNPVVWVRLAAFCFLLLALATSAGSLNGSSMRLNREEFIHISVTKTAENTIQATIMETIKTVMAHSYLKQSGIEPFNPGAGF